MTSTATASSGRTRTLLRIGAYAVSGVFVLFVLVAVFGARQASAAGALDDGSALGGVLAPVTGAVALVTELLAPVTEPVDGALAPVTDPVTVAVRPVLGAVEPAVEAAAPVVEVATPWPRSQPR